MDQSSGWCWNSSVTNNIDAKESRVGSGYGSPIIQQLFEPYIWDLPRCLDSPDLADNKNMKRKAPDGARDPGKKKEIDRAYRMRLKAKKMETEANLASLTEENDKLKRENNQLKQEEVCLQETLHTQKQVMEQLQSKFGQLKVQLDRQNTVVEVLSKQLALSKDIDLLKENEQLKREKDVLSQKMNNQGSLNIVQLEAKIMKLEQEKGALQVIIDALCAKINKNN